jgi:hypothetical protein
VDQAGDHARARRSRPHDPRADAHRRRDQQTDGSRANTGSVPALPRRRTNWPHRGRAARQGARPDVDRERCRRRCARLAGRRDDLRRRRAGRIDAVARRRRRRPRSCATRSRR